MAVTDAVAVADAVDVAVAVAVDVDVADALAVDVDVAVAYAVDVADAPQDCMYRRQEWFDIVEHRVSEVEAL